MIGIDTNVLLRLLVRDDETQLRAAERFIAAHCAADDPGYVSHIVIVEVVWALKGYFGYDRTQIGSAIRGLLDVSELEVESAEDVHAALKDYESSTAGFADCLLARSNVSTGCEFTITFDRKAAKLKGFELLK